MTRILNDGLLNSPRSARGLISSRLLKYVHANVRITVGTGLSHSYFCSPIVYRPLYTERTRNGNMYLPSSFSLFSAAGFEVVEIIAFKSYQDQKFVCLAVNLSVMSSY